MNRLKARLLWGLAASAAAGAETGPAAASGLQCLGQLRCRRSEEIAGSRWGVSCCWIADEHPLRLEQRLDHLSAVGAKWALLVPDWNRLERQKGKYDWNAPAHRLDDVINGLAGRKIAPVVQIYGGHRLYMQTRQDSNNRPLADAARLLDDPEIRAAWLRFVEALVYWLAVPMETKFPPASVTVTMAHATIQQPVLVDLLDGRVYALSARAQAGALRCEHLPLADSPLVLCSRAAVEFNP